MFWATMRILTQKVDLLRDEINPSEILFVQRDIHYDDIDTHPMLKIEPTRSKFLMT
jgi:hypothetical protein